MKSAPLPDSSRCGVRPPGQSASGCWGEDGQHECPAKVLAGASGQAGDGPVEGRLWEAEPEAGATVEPAGPDG